MPTSTPHTIGRYEIVAPLATGGMGELFLARRSGAEGFARLVVLKRLRPELGATSTYRDMFFDEARLAARLTHPNVCEVYDLEAHGDDHFLAMPYLEGVPASALLPPPAPLTTAHVRLVAGILVQVCDGLHHAHELRGDDGAPLGVVHRDVSPGNVFVTSDGVVKLLDFGVAKVRGAKAVTEQGVVKGKLAYMAPEQLADGQVDRRADLFCVGILGWEALVGRPLFAKASASLTAAAVLDGDIPRLAGAVDDAVVPAALVAAIERALARAPYRRPATAAALRDEIEQALAPAGGVARASEIATVIEARCAAELAAQRERVRSAKVVSAGGARGAPLATVGARPDALTTTEWARPTRSRLGWLFAGALAVALTAAVWIVFGSPSRERTADAAAAVSADAGTDAGVSADAGADADADADADAGADAAVASGPGSGKGTGPGTGKRRDERSRGTVSIDSTPWAELFVDGKRVGITPFIDKPLPAGKHRVKAVLADGRSRTFTIDVPDGKRAKPVDLRW